MARKRKPDARFDHLIGIRKARVASRATLSDGLVQARADIASEAEMVRTGARAALLAARQSRIEARKARAGSKEVEDGGRREDRSALKVSTEVTLAAAGKARKNAAIKDRRARMANLKTLARVRKRGPKTN